MTKKEWKNIFNNLVTIPFILFVIYIVAPSIAAVIILKWFQLITKLI